MNENIDDSNNDDGWTHWVETFCQRSGQLLEMRSSLKRASSLETLPTSASLLLLIIVSAEPAAAVQSQLVQQSSISPGQVSAQLESLVRRGLAFASRPNDDRRFQIWRATTMGRATAERMIRRLQVDWSSSTSASAARRLAG